MTGVLIRRQPCEDRDTGRTLVTTEADTGDLLLQPKDQKLPANCQKLERAGKDPRNSRGTCPADTLKSGFYPPELRLNFSCFKPPNSCYFVRAA